MKKKLVKISRYKAGIMSTLGRLSVDGVFLCYVLEDVVRPDGVKISKFTALVEGIFELRKRFSPGFNRELWCITNKPDGKTVVSPLLVTFKYSMLHGGNHHEDTEGCPLIAFNLIKDTVAEGYSDDNRAEFIIQGSAENALNELLKDNDCHNIIIQNDFE